MLMSITAAALLLSACGARGSVSHAASTPNPNLYNLRLSDLPSGFATRRIAVLTPAQWASGNKSTSTAALVSAGIELIGVAQFGAVHVKGSNLSEVDSYVFLLSTPAKAHAMLPSSSSAIPQGFVSMAAKTLGALGEGRTGYTIRASAGFITDDLMFVRGRYAGQMVILFKGSDRVTQSVSLAHIVDGRLRTAR